MCGTRQPPFWFALAAALVVSFIAKPARSQSSAPVKPSATVSQTKRDTHKAKKAYETGLKAELAGDWLTAFDAYAQAADYEPGNTEYASWREVARFRMVQRHTDRAEREALAGRMGRASEELRAALQLDPSYSVARERLAQFESPHAQQPLHQADSSPGALVRLEPQPGSRDFNLRGDTRSAYEEVARKFGVVASFDTDLPARPVRLRVNGVDFDTAMTLVGQQTNTFWRTLDPHTFFVAENNPQKRREYSPIAVRTVLLPGSATPERMLETTRLVREIAGITHTDLDTRGRTLTLRDSPENIAVAMALIEQVEQAVGETMLEIEILEVNRNAARSLGITSPYTARIITFSSADARAAAQATGTSQLLAIAQRVFGAAIPAVVALGGGQTIFLATLPGAAAHFSEALNVIRSGRRMLLRAQDGLPATFFIGDRFPVALAVLGASLLPGQIGRGRSQVPFPRNDFATGSTPVAVITGDFNGDTRLDLAVVNKGSNSVSILLGNGDGSFADRTDFLTGNGPAAVVTGDFNADGKTDLAIVNKDSNTVSILLGKGDGTFSAKTDFPTGAGPSAIVAGDFNADGKLDLAITNQTDNTVSILLGKGDGTFNPKTDFPTGKGPSAIAAGNFNSDGKLDLAITNQTDNTVSILLGKGDGTFNPKSDIATGNGPTAVVTRDFNGDNRLDLAIANENSNSVSILLGNGDGAFNPKTDFSTGNKPAALATADFLGNGRLDLTIANQADNTISILLGNGDGTFGNRLDLATGNGPSSLAVADFNADGRPDLAIANQNSNSVSVILNTANFAINPSLPPQTSYPGAEYEDLGLKVRATPRINTDNEVTLQLQFEIRSLSGVSINGIPVISNRTVEQTVRLRENETSVLSGIVGREELKTITTLPGIAGTPGFAHLLAQRDTQKNDTELLIAITPRRLRLASHIDRTIYAGRGSVSPVSGRPGVATPP